MNEEKFAKYNEKREELISKYKKQKLKTFAIIMLVGIGLIGLCWGLFFLDFFNEAVTLVLTAVFVMITIIFARIRIVTIDHIRDEKLRLFEDNDPTFY